MHASLNQTVIIAVIAGYAVVNVLMQINFFAGKNIFDKYQKPTSDADALKIAQRAYYAKTGFLLLLLILLAFKLSFPLSLALSFTFYATTMLIFFGVGISTAMFGLAALLLLGSYFYH